MRIVVFLLFLGGLAAGGWYGYTNWWAVPQPPQFRTAEIKRGDLVSTVSATGTIEPLVKVLVGSQVSGTVMKWYADFNQQVSEGFVLAEIDQDRFKASVEQRSASVAMAKARVEEAAARLDTARIERENIEDAFRRQAASEFELKSTKAAEQAAVASLHAAEASLAASEAELRQAKVELDRAIIRSPISGVVISRDIDAGQTVAASLSAPTLFTIANDLTKMRVNAAVSETDIGRVKEGMSAEFRVDAYPGRRFKGLVSQVRYAETVVDNVVTYTTLIDVENKDLALRPGMTATILFEIERVTDALLVSNAALRYAPAAGTPNVVAAGSSNGPDANRGNTTARSNAEGAASPAGTTPNIAEVAANEGPGPRLASAAHSAVGVTDAAGTVAARTGITPAGGSSAPAGAGQATPAAAHGAGTNGGAGKSASSADNSTGARLAAKGVSPDSAARPAAGGAPRGPKTRVYRLLDGNLVETPLKTGLTDGQFTVVLDGELQAGDQVVLDAGFGGGNRPGGWPGMGGGGTGGAAGMPRGNQPRSGRWF